ncbi:MAG: enoyl-CoA hydratase [Alphaproteobacteria bacterium]
MSEHQQTPYGEKMIAEKIGPVGWVIFNNVERHNALSLEMWEALPRILDQFEADVEIRVIVLKGAGEKSFISGADISEFDNKRASAEAVAQYDKIAHEASERLIHAAKPTIAMIRGYCIGGGLGVALSCDIRIASIGSRFAIPAAKLGLGYRVSSLQPLVALIGPAFAKEVIITARQFDCSEALAMGLINRAVDVQELESYTADYCARIAANAPLTMLAAKRTVDEISRAPSDLNRELCERLVDECFSSADYVEGRHAFMDKRKPRFEGR